MDVTVIHNNAYCTVEFEKFISLMSITWHDQCQELMIEELLSQAKEVAHLSYLYKPTLSISDIRCLPVIDPESQAWLDENLTPIYVSNGLKKSAMVIRAEDFSVENLSFEQLMAEKEVSNSINYCFFNDIESARTWVLQK